MIEMLALSFVFELVEQSIQGRYIVVGAQPTLEIVAKENKVTVIDCEVGCSVEEFVEDPMANLLMNFRMHFLVAGLDFYHTVQFGLWRREDYHSQRLLRMTSLSDMHQNSMMMFSV